MSEQRAHYRIAYPASERPRIVLGSSICEVVECSEEGLSYRPAGAEPPPAPGTRLRGRLRMRHGRDVPIAGVVKRREGRQVTVHLEDSAIPFRAVLHEQLYLRRAASAAD